MASKEKTAKPAPEKGEKQKEVKQPKVVAPKTEKATVKAVAPSTDDKIMQHIKLHGKEFVGVVISDKANKTVTVEWERRRLIPKFERYERRFSRAYAHNPVSINAKLGDKVRIKETRPLSKTKNFVVVEVLK